MSFNLGSHYHNLQSVAISGTCLFAWLLGRIKLSLRCVLDHIFPYSVFITWWRSLSTHMRIHTRHPTHMHMHTRHLVHFCSSLPLFNIPESLIWTLVIWRSRTQHKTPLNYSTGPFFFNFFFPVCFGLCLVLAVIGCLLFSLYFWTYPAR